MVREVAVGRDGKASIQVVQELYHSITGKTENLSRFFFEKHCVTLANIQALHNQLQRTIEQYDQIGSSFQITVAFVGQRVERFSEFSRFIFEVESFSEPVEEVTLQYDLLICLPQTKEPKPYSITIGLRSMAGVIEDLDRRGVEEVERFLLRGIASANGRLSIDYVDYAVAQSIDATVSRWHGALHCLDDPLWAKTLRAAADPLPMLAACTSLLLAAVYSTAYFLPQVNDFASLFQYGIYAAVLFLVGPRITQWLIRRITRFLEGFHPEGYIKLSDADDNLIVSRKRKFRRRLGSAVVNFIGVVVLHLVLNYISQFIA